ncbi:hypothetical protein HDU78_000690 [Chytriomyces hyalinus]|nr:hypothetical protein HDU78_000690 [Chytriomyces hyalinus]
MVLTRTIAACLLASYAAANYVAPPPAADYLPPVKKLKKCKPAGAHPDTNYHTYAPPAPPAYSPPAPVYVAPPPVSIPPTPTHTSTASEAELTPAPEPQQEVESAPADDSPTTESEPAPAPQPLPDPTPAPAPQQEIEADTATTTAPIKAAAVQTSFANTGINGRPDCNYIASLTSAYKSTGDARTDAVAISNIVRDYVSSVIKIPLPHVTWDEAIAKGAAVHAGPSASTCGLTHVTGPTQYFSQSVGQNLYAFYGSQGVSEAGNYIRSVAGWVRPEECNGYHSRSGMGTFHVWGHYSQVLWPESTKMGCAVVPCQGGRGVIVACDYSTPGNRINGNTIKIGGVY